ncbi:helix-turn-helix domain-containing protein [Flexivirga sp. B27]
MGRTRSFELAEVAARAADTFVEFGYAGTSVDDLVRATGLHRGSLYQAFASKRGLFCAALSGAGVDRASPAAVDLLLVALMDLAPKDTAVREMCRDALGGPNAPTQEELGHRLLERAGLIPNEGDGKA